VPVVTFDGATKVITEVAAGSSNTVDASEVYSDWKRWVSIGDNAKYAPAFTPVGGDPITTTLNLGTTLFLENGWRIRPAELDHKLILSGNLYTRESGQSAFLPTLGNYTVVIETQVSAITTQVFSSGSSGGGATAAEVRDELAPELALINLIPALL
jgi:hypothetical protein